MNQTRYPDSYVEALPGVGEKAGFILLGSILAAILMPLPCVPSGRYSGFKCFSAEIMVAVSYFV
jgi:hypothetical protein